MQTNIQRHIVLFFSSKAQHKKAQHKKKYFGCKGLKKVKFIIGGKLQRDNIRNLKFDRKSGLNDLTWIIKLAI